MFHSKRLYNWYIIHFPLYRCRSMLIILGTFQLSPQHVWCYTAMTPLFSTRFKDPHTGKHGSTTLAAILSVRSPPSTRSELLLEVSSSEDPLPIILDVKSVWVLAACLLSSRLSCNALLRITTLVVSWVDEFLLVSDRVLLLVSVSSIDMLETIENYLLTKFLLIASGPIYIGELAPPHIRGKIMTLWQTFYSVGSFICFWVNYGCTKHTARLGEWDWKMVVIFQLLVPVIILILLPTIPGTPRWYIKRHNDVDKARDALRRVRDTEEEVEEELTHIRGALEYEKEAISSTYSALWKDKSIRKRLLLALVINAGQQLTGQGSLNSYSTIIYQKVFTSSSQIALINALNATFGILFTLNAIWMIDRFGRKFLLIVGGIGMGIVMVIVATVETQTPNTPSGAKTESVGIALVFLLFFFILFCESSPLPTLTLLHSVYRKKKQD